MLATEFPVSREAIDEALLTQGRWDGELRHRRADGVWIVVSSRQALVRNDRGEPVAVIELNSDITERTRAERELREAEQRFRGLIESAPDAMVIADEADSIVLVNAQAEGLFGYLRTELIGKPVQLLLPAGLRPRLTPDGNHYMDEPRTRRNGVGLDRLARRKDGREFAAEISVSPLKTDRGLLISASIRDVSQQLLRQLGRSLSPAVADRTGVAGSVALPAGRASHALGGRLHRHRRAPRRITGAIDRGRLRSRPRGPPEPVQRFEPPGSAPPRAICRWRRSRGLLHRLLVNQADRGAVMLATACLAEIDPSGSELRLIRAGHESPRLITREAVTDLGTHRPALGLPAPVDWPLEQLPLPRDAAIMLYTDGLTELRTSPGSIRQFEDLAPRIDAPTTLDQPPGQALDHLLRSTFPAGTEELDDDVAAILLNLSRTPPLDGTDPDHTEHRMTDALAPLT